MNIISAPISILLISAVLVAAVAVWLVRRKRYPGPRLVANGDDIDREELRAAEREVRDLSLDHDPDDGFEGDDWGPGAARRPRSPLEL